MEAVEAGLAGGPFEGFYYSNYDWFTVQARIYGGVSTNLFVFDVGEEGRAVGVSPAVARVSLKRVVKEREEEEEEV